MPGGPIHRNPARYFLAMAIHPEPEKQLVDSHAQTDTEIIEASSTSAELPPQSRGPLIYAALLATKDEAVEAVKELVAQVKYEHGGVPKVLRLHSDKGSEFINDELRRWCADKMIFKTSTAGYDPNGNASAENGVGYLKRNARYLLARQRLPTNFWGVAVLAAAYLHRVKAGLLPPPRINFGVKAMVVQDPKPKNTWTTQR